MRRGWFARLAAVVAAAVAVAVVPACTFTPGTLAVTADAPPDMPLGIDADFSTGWSPPALLTELVDSFGFGADDPSMTNDLLEIYFGSSRSGGAGFEDIWFAKRNSVTEPFGAPMPVPMINSGLNDTTAKITGNGKAIYFASNRGDVNNYDIYVATRPEVDQPWTTAIRIAEVSTLDNDYSPFTQVDQVRLVMCGGPSIAQEAMFVSTRGSTSANWSSPARITELDETNHSECDPIEPRANVLYYATDYLGNGTFDIYRASKVASTEPYGNRTAVSLSMPGVNDRDPWVSPDEQTMVFSSDRTGGKYQIYMSTR